jgi:uncharacterized repeat protein (TIGR01451 family)
MSDCGLDNSVADVTITFDDNAGQRLPDGDPGFSSGSFEPTNYGSLDNLPAPAPSRPFGTALSVFKDSNPNGTWSLYVVDDQALPEVAGFISDGWTLNLTVADPIADLALTQSGPTTPIFVGSNLTYTITVTNRGPAITTALVQDPLPASQSFVSAVPTVGSCTHSAGTVTCDLGNLLVGQGARITLVVSPISGATSTNIVTVAGNQLDQNPSNNVSGFVTSSIGLSDIAVGFGTASNVALLGQPALYSVVVTNHGPNRWWGDAHQPDSSHFHPARSPAQPGRLFEYPRTDLLFAGHNQRRHRGRCPGLGPPEQPRHVHQHRTYGDHRS